MAKRKRRTPSATIARGHSSYVKVAIKYAQAAAADRAGKKVGKWVRLAAQRFLDDLARSKLKRTPFSFSDAHADDACDFIEKLPHVEGEWETGTIKLDPSQVFFVVNLFGFRKPDGSRRFSTALYAVARKNAKSTLAAAIMLYCFCCESEVGAQAISAATTGQQARIVWNIARRMVQKTQPLREAFTLEAFANAIARYEVGGSFRPVNSKASTQDGLNPSALSFDELHAHKTRDLFDVLRSAAGARKNPLFLYTTTEGYENPGPWAEVRHFARQILEGVIEADHFLAIYYALDPDDDDFDESKWIKANPLLGVSVQLSKLREYAIEAKRLPGALSEFRIKRLNRPAAAAEGWIDLPRWKACGRPVNLDELAGQPCWAAFDLASTRDMNAWRLLWLVDGTWYTWGRYWVPSDCVHQRTERGSAPYSTWLQTGHLQVTAGDVADYAEIENDIVADCDRFQPRQIAYDAWNAADLVNRLVSRNLPMIKFIQGPKSFNPAMQALERAYTAGVLRHGDNPILTWNAANIVPRRDANLNMAPDKKRSPDKIDGIVALLMAFGLAVGEQDQDISDFLTNPIAL